MQVLIIEEASMLASELVERLYILHMALVERNPAFRMVLCYDGDQLPPINGKPLFLSKLVWGKTRVVALQQPQRQNREDCDIRLLVTDGAKGGKATDRFVAVTCACSAEAIRLLLNIFAQIRSVAVHCVLEVLSDASNTPTGRLILLRGLSPLSPDPSLSLKGTRVSCLLRA